MQLVSVQCTAVSCMNTKKISKARPSGQSVAGSTKVRIEGCQQTVRWLTKAYEGRRVLLSCQKNAFDKFVASSGNKFGQTEAQVLRWLCEDSSAGNRHELLEKLTKQFVSDGHFPRRIHAIFGCLDLLIKTYGDRKTKLGIRSARSQYGRYAGLADSRPSVSVFNDGRMFKNIGAQ